MRLPKTDAILKASPREGSYFPFSIAMTVWRETPREAPNSACVQRFRERHEAQQTRRGPPRRGDWSARRGQESQERWELGLCALRSRPEMHSILHIDVKAT